MVYFFCDTTPGEPAALSNARRLWHGEALLREEAAGLPSTLGIGGPAALEAEIYRDRFSFLPAGVTRSFCDFAAFTAGKQGANPAAFLATHPC
jgi:hypothetical protein